MAHVSLGALARARRGRLLHDRGLDDTRARDFYTLFVIELRSRTVRVVWSAGYPDAAFVVQALRPLTDAVDDILRPGRVLICGRDPKWGRGVP